MPNCDFNKVLHFFMGVSKPFPKSTSEGLLLKSFMKICLHNIHSTIVIRNGKIVWKHGPKGPFFLYDLLCVHI